MQKPESTLKPLVVYCARALLGLMNIQVLRHFSCLIITLTYFYFSVLLRWETEDEYKRRITC